MTPVEKGRFCASCQKTVLAFTYLSDNEIIKLVSKNENLCGRFIVNQLDRNLIETKRTSNYFGYVATSVLAFLGLGANNIIAQEKPKTFEQTDSRTINKINKYKKKRKLTVSGIVTNNDGQIPLIGASVSIKGSKKHVSTDKNGKYTIEVKQGKISKIFSFLGLEEKRVKVMYSETINVRLRQGEMLMGMIVVE